jgi:hypothetical protein
VTDFRLDRALVDAMVAGTIDRQGEAELAEQVARVLPFHWTLPDATVAALTRIRDHLGGDAGLLDWLDRHPGRPRLVARLYELAGLLDELSAQPAVVEAVRAVRAGSGDPAELTGCLVPDTDSATLASLGAHIERLLGEDRDEDAVRVALATVAMVRKAAPTASAPRDLDDRLDRAARRIAEVDRQ